MHRFRPIRPTLLPALLQDNNASDSMDTACQLMKVSLRVIVSLSGQSFYRSLTVPSPANPYSTSNGCILLRSFSTSFLYMRDMYVWFFE